MSCFRIWANEQRVRTTETGLRQMTLRMYEEDFNEQASGKLCSSLPQPITARSSEEVCLSHEDQQLLLNIMRTESRFVNGHYQLPLPFRTGCISMPNNRNRALQRIDGPKKRFIRDRKFKQDYIIKFMSDIIDKGYARKVLKTPIDESETGSRYYSIYLTTVNESMFHQVRVSEPHTKFLRFVWWTDGNTEEEPEEYQMQVHLFGSI